MQFFRGAVNAISAPYQYYKELPPINPATLTGAIDVIVVKRPGPSGETELVCSPFHVRFGKWQVLRPSEKKVTVAVNGHVIPFGMKIGEAGEAFFVFETEDDVPADLITSPILHSSAAATSPSSTSPAQKEELEAATEKEPEPLDLNATPEASSSAPETDSSSGVGPRKLDRKLEYVSSLAHAYTPSSLLTRAGLKADSTDVFSERPDEKVDKALHIDEASVQEPNVDYRSDVALDMGGYHTSKRVPSETIVPPSEDEEESEASSSSSPPHIPFRSPKVSPFYSSGSVSAPPPLMTPSSVAAATFLFPTRATSEPPPAYEGNGQPSLPAYQWDWGGFPQPSPVEPNFPSMSSTATMLETPRDRRRLVPLFLDEQENGDGNEQRRTVGAGELSRSQSVPPELDGSPATIRQALPADVDSDHLVNEDIVGEEETAFGAGGVLTADESDTTIFSVELEGSSVEFELSIVDGDGDAHGRVLEQGEGTTDQQEQQDKIRFGRDVSSFDVEILGEVEAARVFDNGKVNYQSFMDDEHIVRDSRLVIRWAGEKYITRADGSPLMDSLIVWRATALRARAKLLDGSPSAHIVSLEAEDELASDRGERQRAQSEPPEAMVQHEASTTKPTPSSWVKWWNRSRDIELIDQKAVAAANGRPELKNAATAPVLGALKPPKDATYNDRSVSTVPFPAPVEPVSVDKERLQAKKFAKTLRLTSEQLKTLDLKTGPNAMTFSLSASGAVACSACIYVWDHTDKVVVSDIDGTITKSDGLGHFFTMIGRDWTHSGVAKLYTDIARNGYKLMYLTSRAIGQADSTRDYLKGIKQDDHQLPIGPVIMSPDRLIASLHREVIMRKPEVFKMACLRDIQRLFGEHPETPFYAGFGNRITDALSYRSVNIPSSRIFTIDSSSEVKMELLELAGYKSSYIHMTDLVDQMFPPINLKWAPEFTDFNYWKTPVRDFPLPDLSPPSPALSARSDTSATTTFSRLRHLSVMGGRSANPLSLPPPVTERSNSESGERSPELRQMSSFERLSSTLASFAPSAISMKGNRRSVSPDSHASTSTTYLNSGSEDEDGDGDLEAAKRRRRRQRRTSIDSMPGSLLGADDEEEEEMRFAVDEEQGYGYEGETHDQLQDDEDNVEHAFDDALMAAGEMENVPFL